MRDDGLLKKTFGIPATSKNKTLESLMVVIECVELGADDFIAEKRKTISLFLLL